MEVQRVTPFGRSRAAPRFFLSDGVQRACPLARVWGATPQPAEAALREWPMADGEGPRAGHGCDRGERWRCSVFVGQHDCNG